MKIIIDDCNSEISVKEFLEPTFVSYQIEQDGNKISLSEYQAKELKDALEFLIKRMNHYE